MLEVKILDVYHDGWRDKSIDEVYLEVMKRENMEGIIDFIVKDEYHGYSIQFYEFSKLAEYFKLFPTKAKEEVAFIIRQAMLLMRYNNDVRSGGEESSNEYKKQFLELLRNYEYKEDEARDMERFFEQYQLKWDIDNLIINNEIKLERTFIDLDQDDEE